MLALCHYGDHCLRRNLSFSLKLTRWHASAHLSTAQVCACVCACVSERQRERENRIQTLYAVCSVLNASVCLLMCFEFRREMLKDR